MSFIAGAVVGNLILDTTGFTGGITASIAAAASGGPSIAAPLIGAASAIASAFKSAFNFISETVSSVGKRFDDMGEAAEKAGVSTEFLSRIGLAAKDSGSSMEGLGDALKFLNKNMGEAAKGDEGAVKAFAAIGISQRDVQASLGDTEGMFRQVVDQIGGMSSTAEKTAGTMGLLGRSGSELIPLINQGADGLAKWSEISDKMGHTVSSASAEAGDKFGHMSTVFGAAWEGIKSAIAEPILNALGGNMENIEGVVAKVVNFVKVNVPPVLKVISFGLEAILGLVNTLLIPLQVLGHVLDGISRIFGGSWNLGGTIADVRSGLSSAGNGLSEFRASLNAPIQIDVDESTTQIASKLRPMIVEARDKHTQALESSSRRGLVAASVGGR